MDFEKENISSILDGTKESNPGHLVSHTFAGFRVGAQIIMYVQTGFRGTQRNPTTLFENNWGGKGIEPGSLCFGATVCNIISANPRATS